MIKNGEELFLMKRSEIQAAVAWAKGLLEKTNFKLPEFAEWPLEEWRARRAELDTIVRTMRGWDVTDFGSGDFGKTGAVLFTIRNGVLGTDIGCPYAEKLIFMREGQILPLHFHFSKTEDIINRGGGVLQITVYNSRPDESVDWEGDVTFEADGMKHTVPAGTAVEILPGNSMTIRPYMYHLFSVKPGTGDVMCGEVSAVNDDNVDNRFAEQSERFMTVEEDVEITVPLVNEYERVLGGK